MTRLTVKQPEPLHKSKKFRISSGVQDLLAIVVFLGIIALLASLAA